MKRKQPQKRSGTLKRKLKYLLLLLLLSFNFTFAFGHIRRLNEEIDKLNAQVQAQQALIHNTESQINGIQNALTAHEMKINILSKADPTMVVQTFHKVAEKVSHVPVHLPHIDPSALHLVDTAAIAATVGVAVSVVGGVVSGLGKLILP